MKAPFPRMSPRQDRMGGDADKSRQFFTHYRYQTVLFAQGQFLAVLSPNERP